MTDAADFERPGRTGRPPLGLRVMAASPDHIFAMKALAARTRDVDDLRSLAALTGVDSVEAALRICADFYPDEKVSPRALGVLEELFGRGADDSPE